VTGGDGGLGFPISLALASRGASVVIASRNLSKCQKAARDIAQQTGSSKVTALTLDLGSLASVRKAAAVLTARRIDLLVNNAGIAGNPQHLTEDGFQLLFQVNYLGPFLLTHLLLPSLRESNGRVVNVASSEQAIACQAAGWPVNCLSDLHLLPPTVLADRNVTIHYNDGLPTELRPIELYGVTKSLLVQHAAELARREHGIIAYSLTPGWVNTSINHIQPADLNTTQGRRKCYEQRGSPCPFIPEQGAAVTAVCALEHPAPSGAYISRPDGCRS
jgi:NAD(P)-dependent dehydrogenase (short-subunit alcohol dehydrogenase family)